MRWVDQYGLERSTVQEKLVPFSPVLSSTLSFGTFDWTVFPPVFLQSPIGSKTHIDSAQHDLIPIAVFSSVMAGDLRINRKWYVPWNYSFASWRGPGAGGAENADNEKDGLCWQAFIWIRSVAQSCPTLCDPMNRSTPGLPVHHQLPEFTQTHVHRVSDAIQLSHPLSSPSPPAPNPSQHQSLFQ